MPSIYLLFGFIDSFFVMILHANLCLYNLVSLLTGSSGLQIVQKMAAALGMCFMLFKTVVSSYRSNNAHLKYSKLK